jgi:group I intron endonuclease
MRELNEVYNIQTPHDKEELKQSGIYIIKNLINNKIYVGSTCVTFLNRIYNHTLDLNRNKHCNKYLQRAWNKYGNDNFVFEILEICYPDKIFTLKKEQKYLDILHPEYNICKIAKSVKGRKMSNINKELVRMRMTGENNHNYDFTKYIFYHLKKGLRIETQREFYNYSKCNYANINQMVHNGKTISTKGWFCMGIFTDAFNINKNNLKKLYKEKLKYQKNKQIRYNREIFHFINIPTGEKFNGTRYEFAEKYNLKLKSIRKITTERGLPNSRNSLYGWDCNNRYRNLNNDI